MRLGPDCRRCAGEQAAVSTGYVANYRWLPHVAGKRRGRRGPWPWWKGASQCDCRRHTVTRRRDAYRATVALAAESRRWRACTPIGTRPTLGHVQHKVSQLPSERRPT